MLFCNEKLFSVVRSAKLGQTDLPPVLARLRDWIHEEFEVSVVQVIFDHVDIGPSAGRPRLNVILETDKDYDSWKTDAVTIRRDVERRVLTQFRKLAAADPQTYDTDRAFLVLDNFSDECLGRACSTFLKKDAVQVVSDFAAVPIWKIDGFSRSIVVFLRTDKEIQRRTDDGTCAKISQRCFEAVKQYDEFAYLCDESFRLKFDSKENLGKSYSGSLFYYWR